MFGKLLFVVLTVASTGVFGRYAPYNNDPYEDIVTLYCKANKAEDKVQEVKESVLTFRECVRGLFDESFKEEFSEVTRTKAFGPLFKKHCAKAPQLKSCISGLVKGMTPCLPASEIRTADKYTSTVIDFVCENDGARSISFLNEDGPQCVQEKQFSLMSCNDAMKSNITRITDLRGGGVEAAFTMTEEERCSLVEPAVECMVAALKSCSNPTPGNLAEELTKKLPCFNVKQNAQVTTERVEKTPLTLSVDEA